MKLYNFVFEMKKSKMINGIKSLTVKTKKQHKKFYSNTITLTDRNQPKNE